MLLKYFLIGAGLSLGGWSPKTPPKIINISQNDRITPTRPTKPSQPAERVLSGMFSLEEQIKKMRNNQNTMRKRWSLNEYINHFHNFGLGKIIFKLFINLEFD